MTTPSISVVMPVYNVEGYIAEAVRSVLAQSFQDFELIVVDDGGSDNSVEIARAIYDPRITIVSQENRGLAGARNAGIARSRGRYIALLDSDDRWHPDKLLKHFTHLEADLRVGVSYSGSRMIDKYGEVLSFAMRPKTHDVKAEDILCRNPVGNGSAPVIRRSALDLAAFEHPDDPTRLCWFDESFRQSEDIELWVRLATLHDVLFEGIAPLLTDYRIMGGALSANVVNQYVSWRRMLEKAKAGAPELVDKFGRKAEAYQFRYLARRSVQLGDSKLAQELFAKATRRAPQIHVEEPLKSVSTWAAIRVAELVGPERFHKVAQRYLKNAG